MRKGGADVEWLMDKLDLGWIVSSDVSLAGVIRGQLPLADNNGPLSACFHVKCRQAARRQSRAVHPQTIEHLHSPLWPAPSKTVRRSQAGRRRVRRRALIFRLGARAALVGHLDSRSTELSSTSSHLESTDLTKTDGIIFEEQETDSRTCEGDSTLFYNADVNKNVIGLIMDCTGDSGAIIGVPASAATGGEEQGTDRTCEGVFYRKHQLGRPHCGLHWRF